MRETDYRNLRADDEPARNGEFRVLNVESAVSLSGGYPLTAPMAMLLTM